MTNFYSTDRKAHQVQTRLVFEITALVAIVGFFLRYFDINNVRSIAMLILLFTGAIVLIATKKILRFITDLEKQRDLDKEPKME